MLNIIRRGLTGLAGRGRGAVVRAAAAVLLAAGAGCNRAAAPAAPYVVTIAPLKLILQEITGEPEGIHCLLPPGASPHTYELKPSTARILGEARAVFYVDESIDGWAARLAPGRLHAVFELVPEGSRLAYEVSAGGHAEAHEASHGGAGEMNAHFWSDPVVVRAIVPELVRVLSELAPENAARFDANALAFVESLAALDEELASAPAPAPDYALLAFHPSWRYFFHRYGIAVSAYIEPFPGKEPTPQMVQGLIALLSRHERRVILSEVQLPSKPAEVLAESLGAEVTVIDPLGGGPGLDTYARFIRHNADVIRKALE